MQKAKTVVTHLSNTTKKILSGVLSLLLLVVPLAYVGLKLGFPPESVFVVHLIIVLIGQVVRVLLIRNMIELSLREYFTNVVYKCALVFVLAPIVPYLLYLSISHPFLRFVMMSFATLISMFFIVYFLVIDKVEKELIVKGIMLKIKK